MFARTTAVLSMVVALIAVFVPYFQQQNHFDTQQKEELKVILNPSTNGPILLTDQNYGKLGMLIQMPWELTVSNVSNRRISIVRKTISKGDAPDSTFYSGIDGGLLSSDYNKIELPINLESGDSKLYILYVGALVPSKVYKTLSSINKGQPVLDRDAMKALGKIGIDIFGNSVEYHEFEGGEFSIQFNNHEKSPTFWVRLTTGNGNNFYKSAAKYGFVPELAL